MLAELGIDEYDFEWSRFPGNEVYDLIEGDNEIKNAVAEKYDWIMYTDTYPEGATTYRRMR
jgi:hypothetical protein